MFDPKDSKTIGYHLFSLPPRELFDILSKVIDSLAYKYNGQKFEPHMTLLARIPKTDEKELIDKTKKLASIMEPFEIELKEICTEEAYFRALYLKVKPNQKLDEYHQKALKIFNINDASNYIPHLSLYYGNIPQSLKNEMVPSLLLPANMKFLADKIYLYRTEGETKDWVRVVDYPLLYKY